MDYKRLLEIAKENQISVLSLNVAYEVNATLNITLQKVDFNKLCDYLEYIYLKADETPLEHIVMYARDLLEIEKKSIEEIITINKWDYLEQTNYKYGGF
jgi:hypothetical protein